MLLLIIIGMLLKYIYIYILELYELAITSGQSIMMPFCLMEVLDDLCFFYLE